jgi:hypothetical protein
VRSETGAVIEFWIGGTRLAREEVMAAELAAQFPG